VSRLIQELYKVVKYYSSISIILKSGLRSLEVTSPPHDSSDAGSNPAEVVEFLRTEKFREEVLWEGL
jgi:hypothetical protein